MCVKFQRSISHSSRDIKGLPNFMMGCEIFTQTSPSFWGQSSRAFRVDRGGSLIVFDGGDCRCEVSFQSYSLSNVELGLRNANYWGFG